MRIKIIPDFNFIDRYIDAGRAVIEKIIIKLIRFIDNLRTLRKEYKTFLA